MSQNTDRSALWPQLTNALLAVGGGWKAQSKLQADLASALADQTATKAGLCLKGSPFATIADNLRDLKGMVSPTLYHSTMRLVEGLLEQGCFCEEHSPLFEALISEIFESNDPEGRIRQTLNAWVRGMTTLRAAMSPDQLRRQRLEFAVSDAQFQIEAGGAFNLRRQQLELQLFDAFQALGASADHLTADEQRALSYFLERHEQGFGSPEIDPFIAQLKEGKAELPPEGHEKRSGGGVGILVVDVKLLRNMMRH